MASSTDALRAAPTKLAGFIDLNGYYDTRGGAVFTINLLADLPRRVQYFSLTNFWGPLNGSNPVDVGSVYSEQHLRWRVFKNVPLGLAGQWAIRSEARNDLIRAGLRWYTADTPGLDRVFDAINLSYALNFYPAQLDYIQGGGWRSQLEHAYRLKMLPKHLDRRIYVSGFLDHNLWAQAPDGAPVSRVVTEHQLGLRLFAGLHVVAEARYNQYLAEQTFGVALGLQYLAPFKVLP
ncbi:MAG: hypothetical protein V3V08_11100 [Nannocystaceae bacterium]